MPSQLGDGSVKAILIHAVPLTRHCQCHFPNISCPEIGNLTLVESSLLACTCQHRINLLWSDVGPMLSGTVFGGPFHSFLVIRPSVGQFT